MMNIPDKIKDFFSITEEWKYDFNNIPKFNNEHESFKWIKEESGWPFFKLNIDAPYKEMYNEALGILDLFNDHRVYKNSDGGYESYGWSSVCLHGLDWNKTGYYTSYKEYKHLEEKDVPYKWCEEITLKCPVTTKFFKEVFPADGYTRIRFMKLKPGGYINPHKDMEKPLLYAVNMSLNNPDGCRFRMKDKGDIPYSNEGSTFMIDTSNIHSVYNNSNIDRIHIIVHGLYSGPFAKLVDSSFSHLLSKT